MAARSPHRKDVPTPTETSSRLPTTLTIGTRRSGRGMVRVYDYDRSQAGIAKRTTHSRKKARRRRIARASRKRNRR